MRKILFYTDTSLLGGAEQQMLLLAKFLPHDRFSITLACPNSTNLNGWCQKFMEEGVTVQRIQALHKHDPRHYIVLRQLVKTVDLVHLHVWNPASCRYGFLAARGKPTVVTEHDPFPLGKFKKWVKQKLMANVSAVIAVSEASKKIIGSEYPELLERVTVIHNGVDVEAWEQGLLSVDRKAVREKIFHATPHDRIILCVAELHERKGQEYLIRAFRSVHEKLPHTKLVLVGEGIARKKYERLSRDVGEGVLFLGRQKNITELMAAADLFVLPSVREAFGLVLLEAGLSELPIIATNVGGIPEIICDAEAGLLIPAKNPGALAAGMIKLLEHPTLAAQYAQHAKQQILKNFQASEMAAKTAEVYDGLL